MNRRTGYSLITATLLLQACAAMEPAQVDTPREERQVTTGSNIPKRDKSGVTVVSKEAVEHINQTSAAGAPAAGR